MHDMSSEFLFLYGVVFAVGLFFGMLMLLESADASASGTLKEIRKDSTPGRLRARF
jgi:hypothetical protein